MKLLEEFLKLELKSMERDGIRLRAIGDLEGIRILHEKWLWIRLKEPKITKTGILHWH